MVECECTLSLTVLRAALRDRPNKQYCWMSAKQTTIKAPGKANSKKGGERCSPRDREANLVSTKRRYVSAYIPY